jgi:hypothetical protein
MQAARTRTSHVAARCTTLGAVSFEQLLKGPNGGEDIITELILSRNALEGSGAGEDPHCAASFPATATSPVAAT